MKKNILVLGLLFISLIVYTKNSEAKKIKANIICEYPAPKKGCNYVPGPNYDKKTNCGLIIMCSVNR
jgi:hypothetical protein